MRKFKNISSFTMLIITVMTVLYLLADRYLIQHVEITNVSAYAEYFSSNTIEASVTPFITSSDNTNISSNSDIGSSTVTALPENPNVFIFSDDWNYQSKDLTITINKVVTGTGNNTVTYFVADIIVSSAEQVQSAFANNSFGRNIIAYTSVIAKQNQAIFAINGDYYGFRTDGILIREGVIYRDQPARTGLAFYLDGTMKIYNELDTSAQALIDDGVWNTLSFGPALIENGTTISNLDSVNVDKNLGNHSIQGNNPRTGVGIINPNHFVFIVVDGRSSGYSRGVSLTEFAQIFKELGCTDAYNIDGGGSSTMYFMGRVVNNPLGQNKERGTSDILFISE